MTRLVIHIGDCKAGSTSIQSVLQKGSYRIEGAQPPSLVYAQGGRRDQLNHHRLSNSLFMEKAARWREQAWTAVRDELVHEKPDVMVLSSERFEFADPKMLKGVLDTLFSHTVPDIEIICYVRPHASRFLSGYAQNVKQGLCSGTLEDFGEEMAAEGRLHFAPRLRKWKQVFGDITIRPMIRDNLHKGCVVEDFLDFCLAPLGASAHVESIPSENTSMNATQLEFVRRLWAKHGGETNMQVAQEGAARQNTAASPEAQKRAITRQILSGFSQRLTNHPFLEGDKMHLTRAQAEYVADLYAEDARLCDAEFFETPVLEPALRAAVAKAPEAVAEVTVPQDSLFLSEIWLETTLNALSEQRQSIQKKAGQQRRGGGPNNAQWRAAGSKR